MTRFALFLGITFIAASGSDPRDAVAREIKLSLRYSGSAIATQGDSNRDSVKAGLGTVGCTSNLGPCFAEGVGEATVAGAATCANGNPGVELTLIPGTGHGITRFERTGDLLVTEILSETVCFDPSTRMQFKRGTSRVVGGTGRFAGARGEIRFEGTQRVLYVDRDGNGFAAQEGKSTGVIELGRN